MRNAQTNQPLSAYGAALRRRGDVTLGARARRRRIWNLVLGAIGLGLIAAAPVLYYFLSEPARGSAGQVAHLAKVRCGQCGYTAVMEVNAPFPLVCPACKQRSLEEVWWCTICAKEFQPPPEQIGGTVRCPICGGVSVGSAAVPGAGRR